MEHRFAGAVVVRLAAVLLLALNRQRNDDVDVVAGEHETGDARRRRQVHGDRAVARIEHGGEEAAVARPHEARLGDRLPAGASRARPAAAGVPELALAPGGGTRRGTDVGPRPPAPALRPPQPAARGDGPGG